MGLSWDVLPSDSGDMDQLHLGVIALDAQHRVMGFMGLGSPVSSLFDGALTLLDDGNENETLCPQLVTLSMDSIDPRAAHVVFVAYTVPVVSSDTLRPCLDRSFTNVLALHAHVFELTSHKGPVLLKQYASSTANGSSARNSIGVFSLLRGDHHFQAVAVLSKTELAMAAMPWRISFINIPIRVDVARLDMFDPSALSSILTGHLSTCGVLPAKPVLSSNKGGGFLFKKGGRRTNWKRRFMLISDGYIYYFVKIPRAKPGTREFERLAKGRIPLASAAVNGHYEHHRYEHVFQVITPERTYVLRAPNKEEKVLWLSAIQEETSLLRYQTDVAATQ